MATILTGRVLLASLLLAHAGIAQTQDASKKPRSAGNAVVIDCSKMLPRAEGVKSFEDDLIGIRFEYPAYLILNEDSLSFTEPPCGASSAFGGGIRIEVTLPKSYAEPLYDRNRTVIETNVLNALAWRQYTSASSVRMCTFAHGEQVCIFDESQREHQVPDTAIEAMKRIEASFAFTDPAKRMDARIASMKVGERYRGLTVRRVITRQMAMRDPKKYWFAVGHGGFGEIYFDGTLSLRGSIEDAGTGLSPGQYRASPDSEDGPQLPFYLDRNLGLGIVLHYPPALRNKLRNVNPNSDLIIVLKNIRAAFGPLGGESLVEADLVSVASASRP